MRGLIAKRKVHFHHNNGLRHRGLSWKLPQAQPQSQDRLEPSLQPASTAAPSQPSISSSTMDDTNHFDRTPEYLLTYPRLQNLKQTSTSALQAATIEECLPYLDGINVHGPSHVPFTPFDYHPNGVLTLQKKTHVEFLHESLGEYPGAWVGIDASRPWMVYWALLALHFLGEETEAHREQVVKTFAPLQNTTGGYGGGEGHLSHLAGTYAAILSLALVGGEPAWALSDREAMWQWLGRLKQADGGFRICEGGEQDTRGAYCALVVISLLNLPWELPEDCLARRQGLSTFGDGLGEYLQRCQTYEGGISGAPGNEAHGAYAFCAIACLCLLDRPDRMSEYVDTDRLLEWLSSRQYAPEGGLAGRTNKVVDGCYSHWLGGCWPLVQASMEGPVSSLRDGQSRLNKEPVGKLYHAEGLARYILNCCQDPDGGLRDKPSKRPDSYHTCYTLAGVSTTEHYHYYEEPDDDEIFASAFTWKVVHAQDQCRQEIRAEAESCEVFDAQCGLNAVHPIFVIPHSDVIKMREWSLKQKTSL